MKIAAFYVQKFHKTHNTWKSTCVMMVYRRLQMSLEVFSLVMKMLKVI